MYFDNSELDYLLFIVDGKTFYLSEFKLLQFMLKTCYGQD